jgi:mono/diheme cytochrome c family protein
MSFLTPREIRGFAVGVLAGLLGVAIPLALAEAARPRSTEKRETRDGKPDPRAAPSPVVALSAGEQRGADLFGTHCTECHGLKAEGAEGPDLYELRMSDQRLQRTITEGIKGEMPAFGKKLGEAEIAELISFIRTLKKQ